MEKILTNCPYKLKNLANINLPFILGYNEIKEIKTGLYKHWHQNTLLVTFFR